MVCFLRTSNQWISSMIPSPRYLRCLRNLRADLIFSTCVSVIFSSECRRLRIACMHVYTARSLDNADQHCMSVSCKEWMSQFTLNLCINMHWHQTYSHCSQFVLAARQIYTFHIKKLCVMLISFVLMHMHRHKSSLVVLLPCCKCTLACMHFINIGHWQCL